MDNNHKQAEFKLNSLKYAKHVQGHVSTKQSDYTSISWLTLAFISKYGL